MTDGDAEAAPAGRPARRLPGPALSRRGILFGGAGAVGAVAAAGIATAVAHGSGSNDEPAQAAAPWTPLPTPGAAYLHVVAHPDDDLYFFNPDLEQAIRSGAAVTSVVITAAEDDGRNHPRYTQGYASLPADIPGYVAARTQGLRSAYAAMAVGDRTSAWRREVLPARGGQTAELATLIADERIRLVFLYLHDVLPTLPGASLLGQLWEGTLPSLATVVPTDSPVTASSTYSAADLVGTLVDLMTRYKPTVVRTMDPDPEQRGKDPKLNGFGAYSDNGDHTAAGLFALKALQQYQELSAGSKVVHEGYRGYGNERWPHSLSAPAFRRKLGYLGIYGDSDGAACGKPYGCGDLKVGADAPIVGWGRTTGYRYPGSTTWLRQGPDGRLTAFAVLGGQAVMWTEKSAGSGTWTGPTWLAGRPLAPHIAPVLAQDGRWHVFGVAQTLAGPAGDQYRPVMTAVQNTPGGGFSAWANIGTPNFPADQRRGIGVPAAGRAPDGRLMVFLRDWGLGLSGVVQDPADGVWGQWADLGGDTLQDGVFCLDEPGVLEIYSGTDTEVVGWHSTPGQSWLTPQALPMIAPAGPVTAVTGAAGRRVLIARQADTGWVIGYRQSAADTWNPVPVLLGGHGGFGPVAVAAQKDKVVLAQRNDAGTVSVAWATVDPDAPPAPPRWAASGPLLVHMPAVAVDAAGHVVVACVTPTGRLYFARQKGSSETLGEWKAAA